MCCDVSMKVQLCGETTKSVAFEKGDKEANKAKVSLNSLTKRDGQTTITIKRETY